MRGIDEHDADGHGRGFGRQNALASGAGCGS
jgi:hypothetical protein